MEVLINKNSGVLEVNVTGRIDTNTAPELESAINKELGDLKVVELNLSGVIYISSQKVNYFADTSRSGNEIKKRFVERIRTTTKAPKFLILINDF